MMNYECIGGPYHGKRVDHKGPSFVLMLQPKIPPIGWHTIEELDELLTIDRTTYYLHMFIIDEVPTLCWVYEDLTFEDALGYIRVMGSKAKYAATCGEETGR